jgi:hypothetical protein
MAQEITKESFTIAIHCESIYHSTNHHHYGISWGRPEVGDQSNSFYFQEDTQRFERPHILGKNEAQPGNSARQYRPAPTNTYNFPPLRDQLLSRSFVHHLSPPLGL